MTHEYLNKYRLAILENCKIIKDCEKCFDWQEANSACIDKCVDNILSALQWGYNKYLSECGIDRKSYLATDRLYTFDYNCVEYELLVPVTVDYIQALFGGNIHYSGYKFVCYLNQDDYIYNYLGMEE